MMDDSTRPRQHGKVAASQVAAKEDARSCPPLDHGTDLALAGHRKDDRNEQYAAIHDALGPRSIVLVGLMGAGKTAVGKRLAARLDLPFVDADTEIETAAGQTVSEIFTEHGEAYFREGERKVIKRLLEAGPQILSTGGGAFMNEETRGNIAARAVSIWLRADLRVLLKRVSRRGNRPLLASGDPEQVMRKLLAEREPIYAKADIVVDSRDVPHDAIVNAVIDAIAAKLGCDTEAAKPGSRKKVP